ncbi:fructokinase [Oceaniovalibus guishaninsula JLT2003]|uniref:Fructokinase n=1 Tax=Oceaniovalibus guishaninsula JLT2003 TaxID=1231392 RepID=K2HDC5_9RHOB|nr:carbohydrate kinase [Oceaniovalibus guishaninsula]EKE45458.1 fructokinase [Oceaniovalibus guishaninsula JLT2003]
MILCCGEALIDMLPRRAEGGGDAFAPHPGGSVFNTAIALARLGARTGFFSGLSTDLFGRMLTDALARDGIDTTRAALSDRPTTLAFVTLREGHAAYLFYDENTAGRMLDSGDLPDLSGVRAAFFGGISLAVEPCATAYATLCDRLDGVPVMLDPNIRPGFIRDEAAYRARLDRMLRQAAIVKLSDEDLHWLEGAGDQDVLARKLLDRGPRLVCITQGAKGAIGYFGRDSVFMPSRRATVVDTVGAGDTFNAGILAALDGGGRLTDGGLTDLDRDTVAAALDLGVRAAAVTVARAGANPPRRNELA